MVKTKADNFEVGDPDKAMENFQMLLGDIIKVHKRKIGTRAAPKKLPRKRKESNPIYEISTPIFLQFYGQPSIWLPCLGTQTEVFSRSLRPVPAENSI